ncbi:MAG TPA: LTA synthase family protein [Holophagaceae bacterium]|nr:LTA synthase family protein [Holophagaceae bacterium]
MTILTKFALILTLTLAAFTLCRGLLYFKYRPLFAGKEASAVGRAFLRGLRFDLSIILTLWALPMTLLVVPIPDLPMFDGEVGPWSVGWLVAMLIVFAAMLLLLVSDLFYFGDVQRHLGSELTLLWEDRAEILGMIRGGYAGPLGLALLGLLGLAAAWVWVTLLPMQPVRHPFLDFMGVEMLAFLAVRGTWKGKSLNIIDAFDQGDTDLGNLALNGVFTTYHATRASRRLRHRFMPDEEANRIVREELGGLTGVPVAPGERPFTRAYPDNRANGCNLVFLLLESWSSKYVDAFGGRGFGVTPNFDRLAAQGLRFPHFHAAGQRSIYAIQALLSGVPVLPGLPQLGAGLEASNVLQLGHAAMNHGYRTLFVKSSKRRSFRVDAIARSAGFQEYYGAEDMPLLLDYRDPQAAHFGWDYETLMFLKKKLDERPGPTLGFAFTGTTHIPYPDLGPRHQVHPHAVDSEAGFLNTLHYADWALGEFFKAAEREPWFDRTIFVLTADTTLGLFQDGGFRERYEIPLLIYAPKLLEPGVVSTIGSQLDLLPTLYDLLGFADPFSAVGDSLFRKRREAALCDQGGILGLITREGYLRHSLQNRLEAVPSAAAGEDVDFHRMERLLLALDQVTHRQLKANRWAPEH